MANKKAVKKLQLFNGHAMPEHRQNRFITSIPPKVGKGKGGAVRDTICWGCENAVPDLEGTRGCPWSREQKPVEGWMAEQDGGYTVKECPLYKGAGKPEKTEGFRSVKMSDWHRFGAATRRLRRALYGEKEKDMKITMVCAACWPRFQGGFPKARKLVDKPLQACKCEVCGKKRLCYSVGREKTEK